MEQPGLPRSGVMIAIVGPSGAGKDSLINAARAHYRDDPRIGFVRRVITRPADGATEDHVPVTASEFERRARTGRFAVRWDAHGLRYGIPVETSDEIAAGRILVANGSRAALDAFEAAYPACAVIEVVARPEIIAARLAGRGRETAVEVERRLTRDIGHWRRGCPHVRIDNSGLIEVARQRFIDAIDAIATGSDKGV